MLDIDGSQKSGSGTILRLSIALAGILEKPMHIYTSAIDADNRDSAPSTSNQC